MSVLSKPYFHNEEAAFTYLEGIVWADGAVCPHCGGVDRITKVKAKAAAKSGASVETEPSMRPTRPGCTYCSTNMR